MTKKEIRTYIKNQIAQNKNILSLQSSDICSQIISSEVYKSCEIVFSYMAMADEVDLSFVMDDCIKKGKLLAIPKIDVKNETMDFFKYSRKPEETASGYYNIQEPVLNEKITFEDLQNKKILFLIPGRAFTDKGDRLGRGKGFYDKYLGALTKNVNRSCIAMCGVCFGFQIVDEIPVDPLDVPVDRLFFSFLGIDS